MGPGERRRLAMDPINYIPHSAQRLASSQNVYGAASPWAAGAHNIAPSDWSATSSAAPLYFSQAPHRSSAAGMDTAHFGLPGTLPHPDQGLRGAQQQQHDALWGFSPPPSLFASAMHSIAGRPSDASGLQPSTVLHSGDMQAQNSTAMSLQAQTLVDSRSSGATAEHNAPRNSLFSTPDRLANPYGQQGASHIPTSHPPPYTFAPSRRPTTNLSHGTPRSHRSSVPSASGPPPRPHESSGLPSPVSDRRRQSYTRGRRYMTARQTVSDHIEDESSRAMADPLDARPIRRASQGASQLAWDEATVRQLQLARGAVASKMVASKVALQSLQSVDVDHLPDNEKTCVICYNDFGVQSPEGINEAPLRLPRCKHIFGDHCIKKWFEDSDSCPYCRDKLPSEQKSSHGSARTFLNMMRLRGYALPTGSISEHLLSQIVGEAIEDDEAMQNAMRPSRAGERRSPPQDAGENQRRTRQRRSSPPPSGGPRAGPRADVPVERATPLEVGVQDVLGTSQQRTQGWPTIPVNSQSGVRAEGPSTPRQETSHSTNAELAGPPYDPFSVSIQPMRSPVRAQPRVATPLRGQEAQGSDMASQSILARAWAMDRTWSPNMSLVNPLHAFPRTSIAMGTTSNGGPSHGSQPSVAAPVTLRPSRQVSAEGMEPQTRLPTEAASLSRFDGYSNRQ